MKIGKPCSHCGAGRIPQSRFCAQCGQPFSRRAWGVALVWLFLIIGFLTVIISGENKAQSAVTEKQDIHRRVNPHRNPHVNTSPPAKKGPVEMARIDELIAKGDAKNGLLAEAVGRLDQVLSKKPGYPYALRLKANLLRQMNDHGRAIAAYDDYLSLFPEDPNTRFSLAKTLVSAQQWDRAVAELESLIAAFPNYREVYPILAMALEAGGDTKRAKEIKAKGDSISARGGTVKPPLVYHARNPPDTR